MLVYCFAHLDAKSRTTGAIQVLFSEEFSCLFILAPKNEILTNKNHLPKIAGGFFKDANYGLFIGQAVTIRYVPFRLVNYSKGQRVKVARGTCFAAYHPVQNGSI